MTYAHNVTIGELLKAPGVTPRVHGNGFIQVDLSKSVRLHVWGHPKIPRQSVATPIHDHIFGFKSTLIHGELLNITYRLVHGHRYDSTHEVYNVRMEEGDNTTLLPTDMFVTPLREKIDHLTPGIPHYQMARGVFHETYAPCLAATVINKDAPTLAQRQIDYGTTPKVLVPRGFEPDNKFDRHAVDIDALWEIIWSAVDPAISLRSVT